VGNGNFGNFSRFGHKFYSVLGGRAAAGWLQGDAANTFGITGRGGGQWRFITTEKVVFCCRTTVGETAFPQVLNQSVLFELFKFCFCSFDNLSRGKSSRILPIVGIAAKTAYPETAIVPPHCSVGKKREVVRIGISFFVGRTKGCRMSRGHEGGNCLDAAAWFIWVCVK